MLIVLIFSSTLSCDENQSVENTNTQNPVKHKKEDSEKTVEAISNSLKIKNPKYSFEHLDNTTGLSSSSINSIFQDSEKLLWIGTWDGLNRYDGNKFKIFRPEINNKNSLSNQVVLKIGEDNDGQIWVLTMHGINKYDKRADTFKRYYFSKVNSPPLSESEFNMAFDPLNNVFCAVKDWGVGYYNQDAFKRLDAPNLPEGSVRKMAFTKSGDLILLFENNELHLLNIKTNDNGEKIISKSDLITDDVHEFEIIQNQKISIISISGELRILSIQHQESFDVIQRGIRGIIGTIPEGLMVSNKSGLLIIDSLGNTINQPWKKILENQKVTTIMYGSENVLWAGTDGNGVFKLYPQEKSFNLISRAQVPELDKSIVRAFTKIEGNSFWVGTKGKGLFRFQSNFHQNTRESITFTNFNESNSPINNSVYALHSGRDGLIFIGTDGDGLCVYDLKKSKFIQWSDIIGSEQCDYFKSIYAIYQDKKGTIWIGTNGFGMIRFKIERFGGGLRVKAFKKYLANNTKSGVLSSNIIFSIIPKNDNELWIGTRLGGLNLLNKNTGLFKTFKNDVNDLQSISSNDILCLHTDLENKLWVGTSFGLNVLNEMKDNGEAVFKKFTVKDGLPNNTIHGIVSDNQNNLWISTNFGLSNFKLDESKFINFTKNEGLQNNEFADGAFYHDAESDYVIMGGIEGFNYFLPSKIMESTFIPNIFINEISGQNKETPYYQSLVIPPDSNTFPSIVLNHDDNYFDIDLAALTYINNEKCKYAYQLGGFNDHWININNRKIISFTNVPPGKYSLWLKWTNSDGAWSNPVQAIDIEIQPIFWRSKTAVISYYLLFVFFILFIWSYFNKQYKLKQNILSREIEEEIHQNRLTFFTNIAHEFQTPLTLITGPIKKLSELESLNEKHQKYIHMVERNSSRLLFLTQQLLEFRKAEFDHLEISARQFNLVDLIEQIAELFDEWALMKNIHYKLEIPTILNGWFDKDKIEKIIFNLLSNAFKFTPENGNIKLRLSIEGDDAQKLIIEVSNSGKGIPKSKLDNIFNRFYLPNKTENSETNRFRTGIGLAYVNRLVDVLRGQISVSSTNGITSFTVFIPCSKTAYSIKELDEQLSSVFISHHLKNILQDFSSESDHFPSKVTSLEAFIRKRKVVLVVEDEKDVQLFLYELLNEKYAVIKAENGAEAIEKIKREVPDIILSDLMMPKMDGVEFCKIIRRNTDTCNIPFIMLTAKSSIKNRIEGLESGANAYIPKPFDPEFLLVKIRNLLEEKERMLKHLTQDTPIEILSNDVENSDEKDFIRKVIAFVQNNIDNVNLQSSFIEKAFGISSSQLYRKIKYVCGVSTGDLIRTIRLKHAAELLRNKSLTVSEVCYLSGFNNRSYFYREFKKMYNITPKNYQIKTKINP